MCYLFCIILSFYKYLIITQAKKQNKTKRKKKLSMAEADV